MNFQLLLLSIILRVADAVIGGMTANKNTFKYQVSIHEHQKAICSGGVLDEWRILTAAVCVETYLEVYYTVYAGSVIQGDENSLIHHVERIHLHPEYDTDSDTGTNWLLQIPNNLAILILREPLTIGAHIQRISLPTEETPPYCSFCTVAGWGLGKVLKWTFQVIYTPQICEWMNSTHRQNEFCANDPSGFSMPEEVDGGSPLVCNGIAVGIYTPTEINRGQPGFYAKIFSFLPFINGIQKYIPGPSAVTNRREPRQIDR